MKSESRNLRDTLSDAGPPMPVPRARAQAAGRQPLQMRDPVAADRRDFIRQVIALLESHRRAGEFERLALFARQDVLGNLHALMPQSLNLCVTHEVSRNLVHLPEAELRATVLHALNDLA